MTTSIYIASPYSRGDQAMNVRHSLEKCDELRNYGFLPFCPLLSHFWHLIIPHEYQYWLKMDLEWLAKCDAVLRMPGESIGADIEKDYALSLGIPVFFSIDDLLEYFK